MIKRLFKTMVAVLAIAAAAAGPVRGQNGNQIDIFESSGTLSSDMTCTDFDVRKESMLTVNQGVTLTLNCIRFQLKQYSVIYLYGTMTGSAGSDVNWRDDSYINVYLSDGAKYTVTGLSCLDGDSYLRYHGYDAATDGNGTVSVTNGPTAVTDISIGYKTTTYTFTATPASGYRFVSWTKGAGGEVLGTNASINVTCEQNGQYQVYANFEEDVPAVPHTVRFADGNNGWQVQDVTAATSATAPAVLQNVMAGDSLVVTAPASLPGKVKSVKAVKYVAPVLVQSIVLDKQTANLGKDSTMTLSVASVLPENAADKSYTWSSDNTSVAIVNATTGVVTGMAAGTANIIATANDGSGVADTCVVTVLSSAILDGVRVLYASDYGLETWSTVVGYNPGVMYQDDSYNVRLTSNGASLFYQGDRVYADNNAYPPFNDYQWLLVTNISGSDFYYHQGETWQEAIDANRLDNNMWSIEGGQVKFIDLTLVDFDSNYQPIAPTATIDPSTVNYYLWSLDH